MESILPTAVSEHSRTILLCDDNILNRKLIVAFLHGTDSQIIETESGRECIETLNRSTPKIDLVLLDISLKDINGIEVCRAIRDSDDEHFQQLPIIAYTARAMEEDCKEYLAGGFTDILIKPVIKSDLQKLLDKYLPK
jgi:CheY-like chemotaxis protein